MTKVVLENLANLQNENTAVATINSNNSAIVAGFENTLSRAGTFPNPMTSQLDMNSNRIINLPSATYDTDPVRLEDLAAYVAGHSFTITNTNPVLASYDFDTRTLAHAATIANTINYIRTAGYNAVGDGGAALYKRASSQPTHIGKVQSADGAWWEIVLQNSTLYTPQVGCFGNGVSCDLQGAFDVVTTISSGTGGILQLPPGNMKPAAAVVCAHGIIVRGVGRGMQYAGYDSLPANDATWLVPDGAFSGTLLTFHTKKPVVLKDFGIYLTPGTGSVGNHIKIDNKDSNAPFAYICNFGSRIENIFLAGGQVGIYLLNCVEFDISKNFMFEVVGRGIFLENDGTGAPFPIIDSGDDRISHNTLSSSRPDYAGSIGLYIKTHGGMQVHDNKMLGYSVAIQYTASIVGETGEINIHDNNLEAWGVNGIRVEQGVESAFCGGVDILNNHFNGGGSGATVQNCIVYVAGISANYIHRGKIIGNDILYSTSTPGNAAISLASGSNVLIAHNTFQVPADNSMINTDGYVTGCKFINNGPFTGATPYLSTTSTLVLDFNGTLLAKLPSPADGSMMYVTDGTNTAGTLSGSGTGAIAKRLNGVWKV